MSDADRLRADFLMAVSSGKSFRKACEAVRRDPDAVWRMMETSPEFRKQYNEARKRSADAMLESMIEAADGLAAGERVRALQWIAERLAPERYGNKQEPASVTLNIDIGARLEMTQRKKQEALERALKPPVVIENGS